VAQGINHFWFVYGRLAMTKRQWQTFKKKNAK